MPELLPRGQVGRDRAVVIAGGGPTGLMLGGELALAGVDVAIVERRPNQELIGSRAGGLHARTIEVLDQRGIADRFLSQGQLSPSVGFHMIRLDISDFPTRHNYLLALRQNHIERLLADWISQLGVPIYRGQDVTGLAQDDDGVDVELSGGRCLRAQYLVGCDGGRSIIRKAAGIAFDGWDPTMSWMIADVEMSEEPAWGFRSDAYGIHAIGKIEESDRVGVVLTERHLTIGGEPTLRDLSEALVAVYGTDYGVHNPTWISRFTDMTRQAASYRNKRILLAGDAAHIHPPMGGQGLNIGVQDAVNLGWKLAQVVKATSPESLLDSYHAERHPVAARCCAMRWRRSRFVAGTTAPRLWATRLPNCSPWTGHANESPPRCPAWVSTTTSGKGTRCLGGECPTSICSPPTGRCGCLPCCSTRGRCSSISVNQADWTVRLGPAGSGRSTPGMPAPGSFPYSERSLRPTRF